jgi:outer membrane protein assembly factor BamB
MLRTCVMRHIKAALWLASLAIVGAIWTNCYGVTSNLTKHSTAEDFQKGQTQGTVIGSEGTVKLGSATVQLWNAKDDDDVWAVNRIVTTPDGEMYAGTSPKGKILRYAGGKWTTLYPIEKPIEPNRPAADANSTIDPNAVAKEKEEEPASQHVYALAIDEGGRLLAGVSGDKCKVLRFESSSPVTVFEPNEAKYIFAMALDAQRNIYLATGPKGKLFKVSPDGRGKILYTATEKNLLSLAMGLDGNLYAGSDEKGRVYKINTTSGNASVVYDADEAEVAALALGENGDLYAAVSSEQAIRTTGAAPAAVSGALPGRSPLQSSKGQSASREVHIARMPAQESTTQDKAQPKAIKTAKIGVPSAIYKITKEGYVTKVFEQPVAFFDMAMAKGRLIVGTGNTAQLFAVDTKTDEQSELFAEKKASQITAICPAGDDILIGTANGAKMLRILSRYAPEATFDSPLVDAGQPATWGKLHIDAEIPEGTSILMSARSGNVSEVNDPTFSPWTQQRLIDEPLALGCPVARFCQYRLILKSNGKETPIVRQVAVASVVGNFAPVVDSVSTSLVPGATPQQKAKEGAIKISIKAHDDNKDTLTYKIEMRKLGRQKWIKIEDDLDKGDYEWDTRKVEDGRYELRATADDKKSNTAATALQDQRISEPVVVDNTPPGTTEAGLSVDATAKSMTLKFRATDELSVIAGAEYAIDSSKDWVGTLPDDSVFDETSELFTILVKDLAAGEHVITVKLTDAAGNTAYKTWDFTISEGK